ncbi:MAG: hypothetical protein IPP80_13890 [Ignavibacteria bacterium]|nr:hypothetical protein [Ignavibacteria bacterium]
MMNDGWPSYLFDVNAETNPEARVLAGVDNLPLIVTFNNGTLSLYGYGE